MSRIADRIQRAMRAEAAPIGFGAASIRRREPTMLLALQLPPTQAQRVSEAVAQGVDTIIFGPTADKGQAKEMSRWVKSAGDVPCGAWLGAATIEDVAAAKEAGADYVVFSLDAPVAATLDEGIGYVLALGEGLSDTLLRVLDGLPLDAMLVAVGPGPLAVRQQLELRRLAGLSRLPLFPRLEEEPTPQDLRSLRDAGAVAVVVDGEGREAWSMLSGLRRAIDGLPARRRREERLEAVLPLPPEVGVAEEEEEFE